MRGRTYSAGTRAVVVVEFRDPEKYVSVIIIKYLYCILITIFYRPFENDHVKRNDVLYTSTVVILNR